MKSKEELAEKSYKLNGYDIEIDKKCPKCNSIYHERNLSSRKILNKSYRLTPFSRVFHTYKCRKCGWESIIFDE